MDYEIEGKFFNAELGFIKECLKITTIVKRKIKKML